MTHMDAETRADLELDAWDDYQTGRAEDALDVADELLRGDRPYLARFELALAAACTDVDVADLTVHVDDIRLSWLHNTDAELELLILALVATNRLDWTGRDRPERRPVINPISSPTRKATP